MDANGCCVKKRCHGEPFLGTIYEPSLSSCQKHLALKMVLDRHAELKKGFRLFA
jgi:hypothetical protein